MKILKICSLGFLFFTSAICIANDCMEGDESDFYGKKQELETKMMYQVGKPLEVCLEKHGGKDKFMEPYRRKNIIPKVDYLCPAKIPSACSAQLKNYCPTAKALAVLYDELTIRAERRDACRARMYSEAREKEEQSRRPLGAGTNRGGTVR